MTKTKTKRVKLCATADLIKFLAIDARREEKLRQVRDYGKTSTWGEEAQRAADALQEQRAAAWTACWTARKVVADWLDSVNGKARTHVYRLPSEVEDIVEKVEKRLDRDGVAKRNRGGVRVVARSEVPTTKSYARKGGAVIATRLTLERSSSAWYLVAVERCERYAGPGGEERIDIHLSEVAKAAVIAKALAPYANEPAPGSSPGSAPASTEVQATA